MTARPLNLADLLDAEARPETIARLPTSGRDVAIATYLRYETRAERPIERVRDCWAPNKPAILIDGDVTWAEFAIVRALERHGWGGRWIKNWTGGRQPCLRRHSRQSGRARTA
jgi:hypothetical protein